VTVPLEETCQGAPILSGMADCSGGRAGNHDVRRRGGARISGACMMGVSAGGLPPTAARQALLVDVLRRGAPATTRGERRGRRCENYPYYQGSRAEPVQPTEHGVYCSRRWCRQT
jgi:hypothetical protein